VLGSAESQTVKFTASRRPFTFCCADQAQRTLKYPLDETYPCSNIRNVLGQFHQKLWPQKGSEGAKEIGHFLPLLAPFPHLCGQESWPWNF
jgi:hypothetical protein